MKPIEKFYKLRLDLFEEIRKSLEEDGHCKSYEGDFSIIQSYPNYFEYMGQYKESKSKYGIELHCYVVGPRRHYDWWGETFEEALDKADKEIRSWFDGN